jgi:hypothetical protein
MTNCVQHLVFRTDAETVKKMSEAYERWREVMERHRQEQREARLRRLVQRLTAPSNGH